jgi:hypothetical protein
VKEKDALPIDIVRAQESALDTTRARLLMHYGPTASRGAIKEILTFLHLARLGDSTLRECLTMQDGPKSRTHDSITSSTTLLGKKLPARFPAHAPHPKL